MSHNADGFSYLLGGLVVRGGQKSCRLSDRQIRAKTSFAGRRGIAQQRWIQSSERHKICFRRAGDCRQSHGSFQLDLLIIQRQMIADVVKPVFLRIHRNQCDGDKLGHEVPGFFA